MHCKDGASKAQAFDAPLFFKSVNSATTMVPGEHAWTAFE